jgi:hypothetical protein
MPLQLQLEAVLVQFTRMGIELERPEADVLTIDDSDGALTSL